MNTNEKHIKRLFNIDPWKLIQTKLHEGKDEFKIAESLTSLGNGHMGMRGNFEENYSGDMHRGSYIAGVWFPDRTRVGWWKNGYPKYFGKAINSVNYLGINIKINDVELDLFKQKPSNFTRTLDMKNGVLYREFTTIVDGIEIDVKVERFISLDKKELSAIKYSITPKSAAKISIIPYIDGNVQNLDSNHGDTFWDKVLVEDGGVISRTKPNPFNTPQYSVASYMKNNVNLKSTISFKNSSFATQQTFECNVQSNQTYTLTKFISLVTDRDHKISDLKSVSLNILENVKTYELEKANHSKKWNERWDISDIKIDGSIESQQGIRFNLFNLFSTFYGEDSRLNIGPKGFTGEKYGGATYWDTEAYCLQVYLGTTNPDVSKQLLKYRHNQLPQAYHNAKQQHIKGALYPMVTFTGVECHNEWEITFEEIHRNAAMLHAIENYTAYTGDEKYIKQYGIDVMVGVSRFWADRVHFNEEKNVYMLHGVTGPNEFENNVNNNFYTNFMAQQNLKFTIKWVKKLLTENNSPLQKLNVSNDEINNWEDIVNKMYLPFDQKRNIFVQHDTFLDKVLRPVSTLSPEERPIVHAWSWDRILRSCFIKQADTLQGIYFYPHLFTLKEKQRNFDFYEPMTVHESSLSPCIHSILACELGYEKKAVEMYLRTARLDLDNYNDDTKDGIHTTSTAGSWLTIVQGFAGMRHLDGKLSFKTFLPSIWNGYSFKLNYRSRLIEVIVDKKETKINLLSGKPLEIQINGVSKIIN